MAEFQEVLILKSSTHQVYVSVRHNVDDDITPEYYGYNSNAYYVLKGDYPTAYRGSHYNRETGVFTDGTCPEDINPYVQWSEELDDLKKGTVQQLVEHLQRHPFNVLGYLKPTEYAENRLKQDSTLFDTRDDHRRHHAGRFLRGASGTTAMPEDTTEE